MEWSPTGQKLAEEGADLFCPKCKYKLKGERNCPNCGTKIVYSGENPDGTLNGWMKISNGAEKFSKGMEKASNATSSFGKSMTIGCTIPILILILILLFL
jgi:DNA-directed RNA polymerase subunit RPC12/RpoP